MTARRIFGAVLIVLIVGGSAALWVHTLIWLGETAMPLPWRWIWATGKLFAAQWAFGWLVALGRKRKPSA